MADIEGPLTGPGEPDGEPPAPPPRGDRKRPWLRWTALALAVVVLGAGAAGWAAYEKLNRNITADQAAEAELERYAKERPTALVRGAQNILLIGSDSRAGKGNRAYGRDNGTQRSDTTILLHLAAHRRRATAVSIPRDLMVQVPACRTRGGAVHPPMFAMFNYAFETGGAACTIRTVEKLTGVRVDHHMVVDFRGFKRMVDAVGGVRICIRQPMNDPAARLKLPAGMRTLDGEQALGYVRARKSLGNGSDTDRMDRQQRFLGALAAKVRGNGVLLNPGKLYPVLYAATSALTTDPGLADLRGLYNLVRGVRHIPTGHIQFLTVPLRPYPGNANRDQLVASTARKLFARLRTDTPVELAHTSQGSSRGTRTPAPSPAPTFRGRTAAPDRCG